MKKMKYLVSLVVMLIGGLTISAEAGGSNIALQSYLTGLDRPVFATNAKDGSNRMFIVEQAGVIKVVQPGSTTPTNFIDLTAKITLIGGIGDERGLLGLTFHPQFATNSYFFVNYTRRSDGATIIERYKAINNNTVGDINSGVVILTVSQPFSNHNGGMIEFRRDGNSDNLYIGMGDGGSGNDPGNRAQNINNLLGKMLRVTPSLDATPLIPAYTIPADNPFVGVDGADEIYAVGLRNPYRWSFDRGGTRQLWAGDVGQNVIEEFDIITRGGNYGWRVYEGNQCTNLDAGLCIPSNYTPPVDTYPHTGGRCSITGGYVYRGTRGTFPQGSYLYGDYCSGDLYIWNGSQSVPVIDANRNIASFAEDEAGEIYLVGLGGTVEKIINTNPIINDANADFDGDGKTDVSVFRPSEGIWYSINSGNSSVRIQQFGANGDIPAPEDYDGDNITDIGVFRPSNGVWYNFRSGDSTVGVKQFGLNGDIPAAGDYDGDARADLAVFRPSNGTWYVLDNVNSQTKVTPFGVTGDMPTVGDYDGDGKADIALWRPNNGVWYRLNSSNGNFSIIQFGSNNDIPVQGDFDNDNLTDQAVFRPSTGVWYVLNSSNGSASIVQFGSNGDVPAVGDYDGDSKSDRAVFRSSTGVWYILRSSDNSVRITAFGRNGDLPAPKFDAP